MKLLFLPVMMAFFAVAQVFCEESDPKEEADYWTSSNQIQDGWLPNDPFREILLRMTRKPRPHQFIGLMGKRSMANAQITHKTRMPPLLTVSSSTSSPNFQPRVSHQSNADIDIGHKVNSFVGLMGKRSQEDPESYEWSTIQTYDRRR